jgi:peptide/nickel transport system permease protein
VTRYILRRLLQALPIILLALVINFILIHLAPGDPIYRIAGDSGSEAYFAAMRAKYGLDRPIHEQFILYLFGMVRGDFGYSYTYGQPVFNVVLERIPPTLLLMATSQLIALLIGIMAGLAAARQGKKPLGMILRTGAALSYALPSFWVGQLLILLLAYQLGLFPVYGMESLRANYSGIARLVDILHHLALPALSLAFLETGLIMRLTYASVREVQGEDYVRTAHAKGLPERIVLQRHMLRNALLPVATVVGSRVGMLLTGAVLVEIVFAWPGLGRLLYEATLARDYPLLMALFLITSGCVVTANLVTDIIYTKIDPRVVYE